MRLFRIGVFVLPLLTACGERPAAIEGADPLHEAAIRLPPPEHGLPPSPMVPSDAGAEELVALEPPFTPGIFPCSQCHVGGTEARDTRPAMPHLLHVEQDLGCADCHAPEDEKADPKVPAADLCFECHDDLAGDSERVRGYFDRVRNEAGDYVLPRRWKTRDTIAAHGKHAAAGVKCDACHGPTTNEAFRKPRSVPLMDRCVACHTEREVVQECQTCHAEIRVPQHADIELHHAEDQRGCLDCHSDQDRDTLHLVNGTRVSFTESYRLCGQCHGPKLRDWKAGIHGKRTGMWDGRKEYLLCAHCHNPHAPRFRPMTPEPPPVRPEDIR